MPKLKLLLLTLLVSVVGLNAFAQETETEGSDVTETGACFHEYIPHPAETIKVRKTIQVLRPLAIEKKAVSSKVEDSILVSKEIQTSDLWKDFLINEIFDKSVSKEISSSKRTFEIGMKVLFISVFSDSTQEPSVDLAKQVFQGRGVPYDHFVIRRSDGQLKTNLPNLVDSDGNPKYYAIVLSTSELGFTDNGLFKSAFSQSQWDELAKYEKTYRVRRVSLYSYPTPALGVKMVGGNNATPPDILIANAAYNLDKALVLNSTISLKNDWHYQAKIIEPETTKEVLTYNNETKSVAAITKKLEDGREQMHFFFTQGQWVKASLALSQVWLNWVTKGTYLGQRRVFLNVHIDDFFLATHLWDPYKNIQTEEGRTHRLSIEDFQEFTRWQHFDLRPKTGNPAFRVEFAFNGFGTLVHKPKDGIDPLLTLSQQYFNQYYWMSHTYTHADLNFTTYKETDDELKKNNDFTMQNFSKILGFSSYYSSVSMVTPKISGLLREEPLRALWDNGIKYVTGDNTRVELRPPHPFTAKYTTKELNGFPGILIVPRNATEIYYNASVPLELVSEYNFHYSNVLKKESTFEDIYDREAERVSNNLLKYDASPYMFHQSNMNMFSYQNKKTSLLSYWVDRVVNEFRKYNTLPILNLKMDDLKEYYLNRMAYEKCGVNAMARIYDGEIQKVTLKSAAGDCFVPVTSTHLRMGSIKTGTGGMQTYGPDTSAFLKMTPESKNIEINL